MSGRIKLFHRTSIRHYLFRVYQRSVTCPCVTIGGESVVFANMIQQHLQAVVEEVKVDSQCGFSAIVLHRHDFCTCQLVEKALHKDF